MAYLSIIDLSVSYGAAPLLDKVTFHIEPGDRICLLGANGAGKSTFLRILAGDSAPDRGKVVCASGIRTARLPQQMPEHLSGCVMDVVCPGHAADPNGPEALQARKIITRLQLDGEAEFATLSGGTRRRVLLAHTLLGAPDVVLLDEPTNHLDVNGIEWLETYLQRYCPTFMFITHDRDFLRRLATRVVELDRGRLYDWRCDYDTFLHRKEEWLHNEARRNEVFDRRLEKEEAWRRQGVKARTVRNQGRLRALQAMRVERRRRREQAGSIQMEIQAAERTGNIVIKAENVSFGYESQPLIRDCSLLLTRGEKVGVLGPNGCGKTTLLHLLLDEEHAGEKGLRPASGHIKRGTNLQVAYADQMRSRLDPARSVVENLADEREFVMLHGRQRHVMGYLQEFGFTPDRARQPVGALSGGECNRLLLARLFARPSNVLVLDEPTNDLDLDTLDLLEEQIDAYRGTVLVVSHDRAFLNNVVTGMLAFEKLPADGRAAPLGPDEGWYVNAYVGGYDDWLATRPQPAPEPKERPKKTTRGGRQTAGGPRLSAAERRELAALPERIEALEEEQAQWHGAMAAPDFYKQDHETMARAGRRSTELESEIERAYARWEHLESAGKNSVSGF